MSLSLSAKRMLPGRALTGTVRLGLDLGRHSAKAALASPVDGGWAIVAARRFARPATDEVEPGEVATERHWSILSGALRNWLEHCGDVEVHAASCALSPSVTTLESLTVAEDDVRDEEELVHDQLAAISLEGTAIATHGWTSPDTTQPVRSSQRLLHLASVDPAECHPLCDGLWRAGVRRVELDAYVTALARAGTLAGYETFLAVDWGESGLSVVWVVGGRAAYVRRVGGLFCRQLVEALTQELSLAPEDAELVLEEYGLGGEDAGANSPALCRAWEETLMEPLSRVARELSRTFDYLSQRHPRSKPGPVLLSGGGAGLRGLDAWLSRKVGHPVHTWSLHDSIAWRSVVRPHPMFATAAALALGDMVADTVRPSAERRVVT